MKRLDFLRSFALVAGISVVHKIPQVKQFDKFYLLQCFIAGFRFYDGPKLLVEMKEGSMLELVREPENEFDDCAIALHFNRKKIGFIPATENETLFKLLDIGTPELMAEITHLEPEAAAWENVAIAISVLKERASIEKMSALPAYLTVLETPRYYTLRSSENKNMVTRIYQEEDPVDLGNYEPDEDWYSILAGASADDRVYNLIHTNLRHDGQYNANKKHFVVADKCKLPQGFDVDVFLAPVYELNIVPDLENYVVLQTEKLNTLMKRMVNLVDIADPYGDRFVEIILK